MPFIKVELVEGAAHLTNEIGDVYLVEMNWDGSPTIKLVSRGTGRPQER